MRDLLIAQALVEHGLLDSLVAGVGRLWYQLDAYVGQGRTTYLVVGAAIVFLLLMTRRRR